MKDNKVENPDRFIVPINNTLPAIAAEVQRVLQKSFLYTGDLSILNIDVVCRVLEEQFKDNSSAFQTNMLKLQEALETPLVQQSDIDQDFVDLLNRDRLAVKNWLERN